MTMMHEPRKRVPLFPALQIHARGDLGDLVARLERGCGVSAGQDRLYVNPSASPEDQLAAIADAVHVLQGGRSTWARQVRHLRALP